MSFTVRMNEFLVFFVIFLNVNCNVGDKLDLKILTVATDDQNDGFLRFNRSATIYGLDVEAVGVGVKWQGGNVLSDPGGGQKINLLLDTVKRYKDEKDLLLLFVDSYDVIFAGGKDEISTSFKAKFPTAKIVFSAESFCWPEPKLASKYPVTEKGGKRFLNSGGFIGFAPEIYEMMSYGKVENDDDDQLYYTKIFLDQNLRDKWSIQLDSMSEIFQNLNGAAGEIELVEDETESFLSNTHFKTRPVIIHGNGPSKIHLNSLGNYIAKSWDKTNGCTSCQDNVIKLNFGDISTFPSVLIAIFITREVPFMDHFFEDIKKFQYPKSKISIIIFNSISFHDAHVNNFVESIDDDIYQNIQVYDRNDENIAKEWTLRKQGLAECIKINCDYYFSIDAEARITHPETLVHLIGQNKKVIAPVLARDFKLWSNFWGALSSDGFYSRSFDYIDIVKNNRRGVWNVPHISSAYLMKGSLIKDGVDSHKMMHSKLTSSSPSSSSLINDENLNDNMIDDETTPGKSLLLERTLDQFPTFKLLSRPQLDSDMAFTQSLRDHGVFMFVSNLLDFGHLINPENFTTNHVNPDLYELYNNQKDWERKYIHANYSQIFNESSSQSIVEQPCNDVYWFPVVSELFCQHLIQEMEFFGKWSGGTNVDDRLSTGYENVPTRDIHMNQVGLEAQWLYFLREYIRPVQEKIFIGYQHDPPRSLMNFVVRYRPDEQPSLRPHHDSSTYTINIALNRPGIDYKGGGCRFIRYNCSITDLRQGWSLLHPGRLTHYHEGLRVTDGTRYIMISFVDP